jgi:hypothetical protein
MDHNPKFFIETSLTGKRSTLRDPPHNRRTPKAVPHHPSNKPDAKFIDFSSNIKNFQTQYTDGLHNIRILNKIQDEKAKGKKILGIFYFQQIKQFKMQMSEIIQKINASIKTVLISLQEKYFTQNKELELYIETIKNMANQIECCFPIDEFFTEKNFWESKTRNSTTSSGKNYCFENNNIEQLLTSNRRAKEMIHGFTNDLWLCKYQKIDMEDKPVRFFDSLVKFENLKYNMNNLWEVIGNDQTKNIEHGGLDGISQEHLGG